MKIEVKTKITGNVINASVRIGNQRKFCWVCGCLVDAAQDHTPEMARIHVIWDNEPLTQAVYGAIRATVAA